MKESRIEDILAKYPNLIEEGLTLVGQQMRVHGRRMDLVFKDTFGRQLIVELKAGPIKDEHIGQIMSYEGSMLAHSNPDLRIMLIGTHVPHNIRRSLDHHGIAWKEVSPQALLQYLEEVGDDETVQILKAEVSLMKPLMESTVHSYTKTPVKAITSDQVDIDLPSVLIRINQTYREGMSAEELFEVTRGIWKIKIGPKQEKAQHAFAVYKGTIKEVYRIDRWLSAGTLEYKYRDGKRLQLAIDRCEFDGGVAEKDIRNRFIGKSCAHYFKYGNASPTFFINCD